MTAEVRGNSDIFDLYRFIGKVCTHVIDSILLFLCIYMFGKGIIFALDNLQSSFTNVLWNVVWNKMK